MNKLPTRDDVSSAPTAEWDAFTQTGMIADYLLYKNQSMQGGIPFDRQNPWNRFGTDAAQFPGQKTDPAHF